MKKFAKLALGALALGAATFAAAAPAAAQVSFGIGVGPAYGGYYAPPAYSYSCDPYSRFYDSYRCGYYEPSYYAPRYYAPSYGYGYRGPSIVIGGSFGGRGGYGGYHGGGGWNGGNNHGGGGGHHR